MNYKLNPNTKPYTRRFYNTDDYPLLLPDLEGKVFSVGKQNVYGDVALVYKGQIVCIINPKHLTLVSIEV